jgi:DNA adenine methylase
MQTTVAPTSADTFVDPHVERTPPKRSVSTNGASKNGASRRVAADVALKNGKHLSKSSAPQPAEVLKPPLKWAGGKRWLVPNLRPYLENIQRRYVEPFCGGLAVPLGVIPDNAILNDMNRHVVNFYEWVQRGLMIESPMENDSQFYYHQRERFNQLIHEGKDDTQEAAELFYYLNRTCYNGLCRFNRQGEFNVPFGKYKTINYMRDFTSFRDQLSKWQFTAGDFQEITLQPDDFVYADPPYDVQFVSYSKQGFSWEDQERLAWWLSTHDGPVIISNQATDRVMALYDSLGYQCITLPAPRRISCNGDRKPALEVLALRNLTPQHLAPLPSTDGHV